jgi:hypothetical protein
VNKTSAGSTPPASSSAAQPAPQIDAGGAAVGAASGVDRPGDGRGGLGGVLIAVALLAPRGVGGLESGEQSILDGFDVAAALADGVGDGLVLDQGEQQMDRRHCLAPRAGLVGGEVEGDLGVLVEPVADARTGPGAASVLPPHGAETSGDQGVVDDLLHPESVPLPP